MQSNGKAWEPIAIVGMACRFPGELENLQSLWRGLQSRYNAIRETPAERWSADRYYSQNELSKGKTYVRRGGYLKRDPRLFDATFFGISPRDAENMDPQQRLMLEVVWEAFENAGINLPEHARRDVGVYVGGFMLDHMITQMAVGNRSAINQYSASGMMMTMLSNRVSHIFDFRGPSLSIDTACSSSLVAFHYACQDIWSGACELAVVGGVNVMMRPEYPVGMCKGHFLARDGECKSFDQRGDGYGRAEGAGVILLRPLSAAIETGEDIWATVVASGTNQDGHTPGISMPNGEAQQALIEHVCNKYRIAPASIKYVECHGTGTAVGDPTEARAIGATYGKNRHPDDPVLIGSIKSNMGHMEAGAGVAGVIKAVLTLHHKETSPLANLQTPNSSIDFQNLGIKLSDNNYPLVSENGKPIHVAINSFGYGGSNAHVILEEYPRNHANENGRAVSDNESTNSALLLPLSARSPDALRDAAKLYSELLDAGTHVHDVIYSLVHRRPHLNRRAIISANDDVELKLNLKAFVEGKDIPQVATGQSPYSGSNRPVFVFTGMGPQWWGMGQELFALNSHYRNAVVEADEVFKSISGFSALEEMLKDESGSQITKTEYAQPANFLIQIGLCAVLRSRGIEPGACVGHSVGELASAFISGALTLEDAMKVCFHRSQQQAKARGLGSMIAIGVNQSRAEQLIGRFPGAVSIAAINGETNITLAGDTPCVHEISQILTAQGVFNRILEVEVPYHGPAMDPLKKPLAEALRSIRPQIPGMPLYSTVTGERVDTIAYGAEYWPENIRQPVEFVRAIQRAIADGNSIFIEIGPHPVLATSLKECFQKSSKDCRQLFTLRRKSSECESIDRLVLEYYVSGGHLHWRNIIHPGKLVSLPNYCWQREMHWLENERATQDRINPIVHPILGTQEAPGTYSYRNDFDHQLVRYLMDHKVMGLSILPAAGFVESFLELAAREMEHVSGWVLRDFQITTPLILKDERATDFVTTYDPRSRRVVARSLDNGKLGSGQIHAQAQIGSLISRQKVVSIQELRSKFSQTMDVAAYYKQLAAIGLEYGPAFRSIQELRVSTNATECLARVKLSRDPLLSLDGYRIHPSLLDGCFQTLMSMIDTQNATYLPTRIEEIRIHVHHVPEELWCLGKLENLNRQFVECNLELYDLNGQLAASIKRLRANAAVKRQRTDKWGEPVKLQILNYEWKIGENLPEPQRLGNWLVIGDRTDFSALVCQQLEDFGANVCGHVHFSSHFEVDGREFDVRPESLQDWQSVFQLCDELNGIVFTSPIDAGPHSDDPTGEWILRHLVTALQGFLKRNSDDVPRIYLVTQGAFQVLPSDLEVNPAQSSINGFARVAFNELEIGRVSSIDLPVRVDSQSLDALIQELICDAEQDEVAIRDGLRFTSELELTDSLSRDLSTVKTISQNTPVFIRPSSRESEIGTVVVYEDELHPLDSKQIRLLIEKCTLPVIYLKNSPDELEDRPWMDFVATVVDVGSEVKEFQLGMRLAGIAPADGATHLTHHSDSLLAIQLDQQCDATNVIADLGTLTRAFSVLEQFDLEAGMPVLIEATPLGMQLARLLAKENCCIHLITDNPESIGQDLTRSYSIIPKDTLGLDRSAFQGAVRDGFSLMAVQAAEWCSQFGWHHLASGGVIVDLSDDANDAEFPASMGVLIKTATNAIATRPRLVRRSMQKAIEYLQLSPGQDNGYFEVALADLAWKKLPFSDSLGKLILSMEPRNVELPVVGKENLTFRNGTYVITGGLGGFGQQTALWLAKHGVRHMVLTGRKGADTHEKQKFVQDLEAKGVEVYAVACDACDRMSVRSLLTRIKNEMPPLRGIVHSAAAIIDEPIPDIDLANLSAVMKNKALAAWILHEETKETPLDHFILYSSAANLVGNSRQSIYSAANGYLNGLVHYRRQMGLPGLSINWGAIGDVGIIARDEKLEQFLRYVGLSGMNSAEALEYLKLAITRNIGQVGVLIMKSWAEWGRFEVRAGVSPRFQKLIAGDSNEGNSESRNALIEELAQLDTEQQLEVLLALVKDVMGGILKLDPASLHPSKPISEFGVDSLMATEIQMSLEQTMGLKVAVLELLGDSTIMSLTRNALGSLNLGSKSVVRS